MLGIFELICPDKNNKSVRGFGPRSEFIEMIEGHRSKNGAKITGRYFLDGSICLTVHAVPGYDAIDANFKPL